MSLLIDMKLYMIMNQDKEVTWLEMLQAQMLVIIHLINILTVTITVHTEVIIIALIVLLIVLDMADGIDK